MLDDYVLAPAAGAATGLGWGGEAELQWVPQLRRAPAPPRFLMAGRGEAPPPRVQWEQLYQVARGNGSGAECGAGEGANGRATALAACLTPLDSCSLG